MKINRILFVCLAIAIPQLTMAKLPFSNDEFGKVRTHAQFLLRSQPESAAKYQEIVKRYVGKATAKELAEARKTPEYKAAYESSGELLSNLPKEQVNEACSAFLKTKNLR